MVNSILPALALLGGLGVTVGIVLAAASKIFYVYVDPKILAVEDILPGANCGGCGLPGCSSNAEAIVAGRAAPNSCVAAGPDVAEAIAGVLGVSVEAKEPDIAAPGCYYGVQDADRKYRYDGLNDCRAVALLGGGMKVCTIGCLGLGTCARACPFDAITMGPAGLPVVDEVKCTGCGTCERVCPKTIINLSSVTRRILKEYLSDECTTPCQRACPAGINIREYLHRAAEGDYRGSVQVIKERNPFPTVIGRICPRPCEDQCRRQYVDEPVAINYVKRFVADVEQESGERIQPFKAPETGRRIAVVGGGVEGLSTAFFSARLGHSPVVYEATAKLGGLLRSAIARERLPQSILDWDIEGILEMGVEARLNQAMGRDFTVAELLKEGFEAVFLASGGWDSRLARNAEGEPASAFPGAHLLIDFMRAGRRDTTALEVSGSAVIYGGGRLVVEAAQLCKKGGAARVTVLLREGRDEAPLTAEDLAALEKLDVAIVFKAALARLDGEEDRLREAVWVNLESRENAAIPADTVIMAAGRFPELIFTPSLPEVEDEGQGDDRPLRWSAFPPYKKPDASREIGLFSPGDVLTDYSGAIRAIGAGRRAAASIHQFLYGMTPGVSEKICTPDDLIQNVYAVDAVAPAARHIMPLASLRERDRGVELEKGFSEAETRAEAARCLQCGLICYEHTEKTVQIQDVRRTA
jgi:NADPH-dependent glutamate synthase beta subunit-like oxidoreductase/formate hydrogenlyase subunit 6/NADH:ubiquinone oxidoreductase subunit I